MRIVRGVLKDYDWGVVDGLARWCGPTGRPQAELWFGNHPAGDCTVVRGEGAGSRLGDDAQLAGMPMVKLLAASTPLSLQVHPDESTAVAGWAAQQAQGGPLLLADDREKSEMLVALAPFDAHAGWRDPQEAAEVFALAGTPADIVAAVAGGNRADAVRLLLALDHELCAPIVRSLVAAATTAGWSPDAVSALARVAATYPGDPGVLVTVLLDHVLLAPGEALAVPAGVVHSYVFGLGVEVMTSSDNVLRLGLTGKPIAVDEALAAVRDDRAPGLLGGFAGEVLSPAGMPFRLVLADQPVEAHGGTHRIVVSLHGDCLVRVGGAHAHEESLAEGEAAVLAPSEPDAYVRPAGSAVVVSCDVTGVP